MVTLILHQKQVKVNKLKTKRVTQNSRYVFSQNDKYSQLEKGEKACLYRNKNFRASENFLADFAENLFG